MGDQSLRVYPASPGTNSCPTCGSINLGPRKTCSLCGASMPDFTAGLGPGEVIHGKYEVISLLGVGGMGEVYKVRHRALDTVRCIKLMKKGLLEDESFQARFIREARIATRIHHPNVAVVHDFDRTEDGSFYLVSEYIDGITLRQWSKRHGRFSVEFAIALVLQVLSGLRHIHSQGLLHRDISGDNIMLTIDHDDNPVAKIIDLGIAKVIEGSTDHTHATQVGMFIGNPKYSSPEQLGMLGENETIDARADLYCLGVVLYEMVLGTPPFVSRTPQGYVAKHLTEKPPRFAVIDPAFQYPDGFEEAVLKSLEKKRDQRYAGAREFAKALRPFLGEEDLDLTEYGQRLAADLPSRQTEALLREVTPLPGQMSRPSTEVFGRDEVRRTAEVPLPSEEIERRLQEREAWENADRDNTPDSYRTYLASYPTGEFAEPARSRIDELEALGRIDSLEEGGELEALRTMSSAHSRHTSIGRAAREALERADQKAAERRREEENRAWSAAAEADTPESWLVYIRAHSDSPRAREAESRRVAAFERLTHLAWNEAARAGSAAAWKGFIANHPEFPRISEANERLAEANAFEAASRTDTMDAWRDFLSRWDQGPHAEVARARLDSMTASAIARSYEEAMTVRSVPLLERFLTEHPSSNKAVSVRAALDEERAFLELRENRAAEAMNAFLETYPASRHAEEVRKRRDAILEETEFEKACFEATTIALQRFLDKFPQSRFAPEAKEHLKESRAFEKAHDDSDRLRKFVEQYPAGLLADRARAKLAELNRQTASREETEWDRVRQQEEPEAIEKFLAAHPSGNHTDEARRLLAEARAFGTAREKDTIVAWSSFLDLRPSGTRAEAAKKRLEALKQEETDWRRAESDGGSASWQRFLDRHQQSARAVEAKHLHSEAAAFERASKTGGIAEWTAFLEEWSAGPHASLAREELERLRRKPEPPRETPTTVVQSIASVDSADSASWASERPEPGTGTLVAEPIPRMALDALPRAKATTPSTRRIVAVVLAAGAIIGLILTYVLLRQSPPPPSTEVQPPVAAQRAPNLLIDALPWARVESVQGPDGTDLISGEVFTPVAFSVPDGQYSIILDFSESGGEKRTIEVNIRNGEPVQMLERSEPVEASRFFEDAGF